MKYLCLICAEKVMEQMKIPGAWIGCVEVRPIAEDERTQRALAVR